MFVLQVSVANSGQVTTALVKHVPTVRFVGQTMFGGVVSTMLTRCVQVRLKLPQQSVALHIREAMKLQGTPFVKVVTTLTTGFEQQLSVANGVSNVQALPHSTVLSGEQDNTGGM